LKEGKSFMSSQFFAMPQANIFAIPSANLGNLNFYFATDTRETFIVVNGGLVLLSEFVPAIVAGITGPQGPAGPTGPQGPAGSDGGSEFFSLPYIGIISSRGTDENAGGSFGGIVAIGESAVIYGNPSGASAPYNTIAVKFGASSTPGPAGLYGSSVWTVGRHPKALFDIGIDSLTNADIWFGFNAAQIAAWWTGGDVTGFNNGLGCAMFRFSTTDGDTTWKCCTSFGSNVTVIDSHVTVDTGTHRFAVVFDDSHSQVLFYIDGALVGTSTTNLPQSGQYIYVNVANYQSQSNSPNLIFAQAQMQQDW
jgi:hypothetical protein